MKKECREANVNFFNSQGSGTRLVKFCIITTRQNGSEIKTAQFVDTGMDLIQTTNLLDMIQILIIFKPYEM